jgi:hypothetical protein
VERTTALSLAVLWEIRGGSSLGVELEHAIVKNVFHVRGADDESTAFRAFLTWDL